jgi:hypothetical protein
MPKNYFMSLRLVVYIYIYILICVSVPFGILKYLDGEVFVSDQFHIPKYLGEELAYTLKNISTEVSRLCNF